MICTCDAYHVDSGKMSSRKRQLERLERTPIGSKRTRDDFHPMGFEKNEEDSDSSDSVEYPLSQEEVVDEEGDVSAASDVEEAGQSRHVSGKQPRKECSKQPRSVEELDRIHSNMDIEDFDGAGHFHQGDEASDADVDEHAEASPVARHAVSGKQPQKKPISELIRIYNSKNNNIEDPDDGISSVSDSDADQAPAALQKNSEKKQCQNRPRAQPIQSPRDCNLATKLSNLWKPLENSISSLQKKMKSAGRGVPLDSDDNPQRPRYEIDYFEDIRRNGSSFEVKVIWAGVGREHTWEPLRQVVHCDTTFKIMKAWVDGNCPFQLSRSVMDFVPRLNYNGARTRSAKELAGDGDTLHTPGFYTQASTNEGCQYGAYVNAHVALLGHGPSSTPPIDHMSGKSSVLMKWFEQRDVEIVKHYTRSRFRIQNNNQVYQTLPHDQGQVFIAELQTTNGKYHVVVIDMRHDVPMLWDSVRKGPVPYTAATMEWVRFWRKVTIVVPRA